MRAIWKGSISFGLVNIPIALYPATRNEELKFRLLRLKDLSPVNYKRVAEKDGREVPWGEIVKGYEYEKGKFVVLNEKDFQRVDLEATQTVDIKDFVDLDEIDPMYFYKPYYLKPQKGGDKAYALLREALADGKKVGIAKVVIKTRQYLAGVKALKHALVLELMHFAEELADAEKLNVPKKTEVGKREREMAEALVKSMTSKWDPEKYKDDYRDALMEVIEEKVESGGKEIEEKPKEKKPSTKGDRSRGRAPGKPQGTGRREKEKKRAEENQAPREEGGVVPRASLRCHPEPRRRRGTQQSQCVSNKKSRA